MKRESQYILFSAVIEQFRKSGIHNHELDSLTGSVFSSSAELVDVLKSQVPLSGKQSLKVIEYSLQNSLFINPEKLTRINDNFLTKEQLETLKKLKGERYKFSLQLGNELAKKSKEWELRGGGMKNKLKDNEIKQKLNYLYRLFQEEKK